jgi:predicted kinase
MSGSGMKQEFTEQRFDYSNGREGAGELVVMVGIPGSGKSTLVRQWVNKGGGKHVRLNRDDMRGMIYVDVPWESHKDNLIRDLEKEMARMSLKKGHTVYIDDTNTNPRTRNDWAMLAQTTYTKLRIVTMVTPVEECIERDKKREGRARVGEGVIRKHHKDLTKFSMAAATPKTPVLTRPVFERDMLNTGGWSTRLPGKKWVFIDVDGTLANHANPDGTTVRSPYDESKVLLDNVQEIVAEWVRALYPHYNICIVSGRHDKCGDDTCEWLEGHAIPFDHIIMRRTGDNRPDFIIKKEILDEIAAVVGLENIAFVLDDRPQVVRMWKDNGLTVYPVRGTTDHTPACPNKAAKGYGTCGACGALEDF